jgi:hypothetical protein
MITNQYNGCALFRAKPIKLQKGATMRSTAHPPTCRSSSRPSSRWWSTGRRPRRGTGPLVSRHLALDHRRDDCLGSHPEILAVSISRLLFPSNRTQSGLALMSQSVESRMGAVAWGLWPTPRFPSPLIELDVPFSGTRLSDRMSNSPGRACARAQHPHYEQEFIGAFRGVTKPTFETRLSVVIGIRVIGLSELARV